MLHPVIETLNSRIALRPSYDSSSGGEWFAPVDSQYFDNNSPITGKPVCPIASSRCRAPSLKTTVLTTSRPYLRPL
jgi:aldehyde dehydrogenase